MIQSPPRRPSNVAAVVILGFFVGLVAEFVINLALDLTITIHSFAEWDVINFVISFAIGAVVGGVMFLGRPRHYGVAAVVGASVLISGTIADETSTVVLFAVRHLPNTVEMLTAYFTRARPTFWVGNLLCIALASGLTALRVLRVRAADRRAGGGGMPPQLWAPPQAPLGAPARPWGPQPPPPYGPPPQAPYGAQPQAPYGSPPQAPYGSQGPPPA